MILAGDIGGTHARLALYEERGGRPVRVCAASYPSGEHAGLEEVLRRFLAENPAPVERAAFGVAGPVRHGRVATTNLPWVVDAGRLADALQVQAVVLLNDLEALAWSLDLLEPPQLHELHAGRAEPLGNRAVLAAGTGLGEATLVRVGERSVAIPSEGGHADFAPRTEREIELLRWLVARHGRASYERVLSGAGLHELYLFLREREGGEEPAALAEALRSEDPAAAISAAALEGRSPLCVEALESFAAIYGAEAGNLALRAVATGGVFLGGGIAPRVLPFLERPAFREAFVDKGRLRELVEAVPVRVILDDEAAIAGAARRAMEGIRG